MTVQQLIDRLREFPSDLEVAYEQDDWHRAVVRAVWQEDMGEQWVVLGEAAPQ